MNRNVAFLSGNKDIEKNVHRIGKAIACLKLSDNKSYRSSVRSRGIRCTQLDRRSD